MSVPTPVTGPPDEGGTADRIAGLQSAADRGSDGSAPTVVDATHGESVHLPGANQPLHADFTRVGHDLHLELPNGETVVVVGFFSGGPGNLPTLWLEGGGRILGETAARLAGPETPARLAQDDGTATDAATGPAPVGAVDAVKGTATVIRADGTEEAIEPGTPIYENDTVVTTGDSALGVLFADNSTMSMGGNARIIIDEMVYDAATNTGSQVFDAVQGSFVFATGEIGHENPEDVQVRTPVATIGIRGTKYGVNVGADDGETTVTLFEGSVSVSNDGGETILDAAGQTTRVSSFTEPPSPRTTLDPQEQADLFGDAIAFSPNPPSSGRSGPGNNDPTDGDRSDLGPEGIEQLADQFAGLDTASGPDGAITDVTQSSAFLSLLDSPFESAASPSGALGDGLGGETGDDGLGGFDGPDGGVLGDDDGASGDDGTSIGGAGSDALTIGFSGTDSFLFNPANPFTASVTGSTAPGVVDRFTLDTTGFDADTTWNVGQTGDGDVVVTEAGGTEVTLDEVEELGFALGGGDDTVTVGDLSNTDIIQDTVFLRGGAGNDVLDASGTDKTVVAAAGTGADTVIGGGGDDALSVVLDPEAGADTVIGGAGDDTLAVSLPVSAAALSSLDPATIEALVALADFVEGGHAATESRSFEALNLTVEGVESLTLYDSAGQAVPTDSVRNLDRVITGDETDETLTGGAGDDRIDGKAGDDIVSAGGGDDEIASNAGADRIDAGPGDDIVTLVYPDAAAETVHGGAGEDRLILEIDPAMTGIDAALADVAAAIKAAKTDPAAAQTVESLGLTFDGFEAVDLFVDDVLQQAAPTVAAAGSGSSAAPDALAEGVTVASAVTIDDADSPTLTQATVTLPAPAAGDSLAVDADSLAQSGLSAALSEGADGAVVLTLSGEAPLAVYQDALAAVRLVNAEPVPTSGARTVEIAVTDDDGITSEAASLSLTVAPPATLSEEPAANSDSALFLQAADADGVVASAVSRAPETEERTGRIDSSNFDEPGLGFAVGARVIQSDGTLSDAAVENVSVGHSNRGSAFGVKGLPEGRRRRPDRLRGRPQPVGRARDRLRPRDRRRHGRDLESVCRRRRGRVAARRALPAAPFGRRGGRRAGPLDGVPRRGPGGRGRLPGTAARQYRRHRDRAARRCRRRSSGLLGDALCRRPRGDGRQFRLLDLGHRLPLHGNAGWR